MNKQGLLLRLILTLILVCTNAGLYAYDAEVNGIYYNLNHTEKTAEVTYKTDSYNSYTRNVVIPKNISINNVFYSVTSIGNGAFLGCSGLISVSIPNSVTSIGGASFMNCSNLTSITIPSSVTSIGNKAFINCSGLTSITISNGVKSIGESAFCGCSGLTSITIPNSVTSIGGLAFEVCSGLTSIIVSSGNTKYDSRNNCNALIETSSNTLIRGCKNTIIPSSVTSIGNCAFSSCRDLTSITIPSSVTSIGSDAFIRCSGLTSVTISNGVKRIGHSAFHYCSSLTSITIPNSVTEIGIDAFNSCSDLTSVVSEILNPFQIDESVFYGISTNAKLQVPQGTKSKYEAFPGWTKNFKIIVETTSGSDSPNIKFADANVKAICVDNWDTNGDGELSEEEAAAVKNIGTVFKGNKTIISFNEFKFFTSVQSIGINAFFGCRSLTSITIPNSVTSIGNSAFYLCSVLTSITIPSSVTSIGIDAFVSCRSLTSIAISNNLKSIGDGAFSYCSGLTSITIPNSVTYIGRAAFSDCSSLTSITISSGNTIYDSRNNCNAIIETSSNTLIAGCKNTVIPNSVTSIGDFAFSSCIGLTSITIPNSVTSIGDYAFSGCSGLLSVISEILNPFQIVESVFSNISSNAILQVPQGTMSRYQSSGWTRNFKEIIEDTTGPKNVTLSIEAKGDGSVSYNGTTIRNSTQPFIVNEGTNATVSFTPDTGYRIQSVKLNGTDVTSSVANNKYTISDITANTILSVTFGSILPTTYSLGITASGNGSAVFNGTTVKNQTRSFTVDEGTTATVTFSPDNGNSVSSVKVNGNDVTSQISANRYTINNITANTTLEVTFQEDVNALTVDGLNYTVTSQSNKTVTFTGGDFGLVLTVPATVTQNGTTWKVTGIDNNVLKDDTELAAIIWNPEAAFTAIVSNPNLLLYVTSAQYAPSTIKNVVVNGVANNITLTDAANGNNFYCPQAFTAQKISYTHHYSMMTGIGESRGWETIALPFDVQKIEHAAKGTIVPFAQWRSGDTTKPFWLYELKSNGFVEASSIKANTPYIISMPNNPQYADQYQLVGNVTLSAENVTVSKSDNLQQPKYNDRTFVPNFQIVESDRGMYALNVNNDYVTNDTGMTEGSKFVMNMRKVHPFEAYMTTSSTNAPEFFDVFESTTTDISEQKLMNTAESENVYDLQGRKIIKNHLSKGIYIVNGQKIIIK